MLINNLTWTAALPPALFGVSTGLLGAASKVRHGESATSEDSADLEISLASKFSLRPVVFARSVPGSTA
ncbi:hypothetical protein [Nocardia stercoris]|nr:hypothetical protein [Nocardia stercoris]